MLLKSMHSRAIAGNGKGLVSDWNVSFGSVDRTCACAMVGCAINRNRQRPKKTHAELRCIDGNANMIGWLRGMVKRPGEGSRTGRFRTQRAIRSPEADQDSLRSP